MEILDQSVIVTTFAYSLIIAATISAWIDMRSEKKKEDDDERKN